MRVAFVWDWEPFYPQTISWLDGLSAALQELRDRGHIVEVLTCGEYRVVSNPYHEIIVTPDIPRLVQQFKPDVILCFGDMTRPNAKPLRTLGIPMALCFTGGEPNNYNTYDFDHIFVESEVYKEAFEKLECSVSIAFGTNTTLFTPLPEQPKLFDTIFPATFAAWKRHDLYASAVQGLRALAVGHMYDTHEQECWQECLRQGVMVLPYSSAETIRYLMAASRVCLITSESSGGSQRTVLEAMAMNLPLIVTDSDKFDYTTKAVLRCAPDAEEIRNYLRVVLDGHEANTREYVLENWSHVTYADALESKLKELV